MRDVDTVRLDPDAQVQQALRTLFATFKRTGSAWAAVKCFREQGLLFPRRVRTGPMQEPFIGHRSSTIPCSRSCAIRAMLGRSATDGPTAVNGWMAGSASRLSQRQAWPFLFQNAHVGYITWDD